jgi:ATP-binding cassette subfamily B multidrug efflux pump
VMQGRETLGTISAFSLYLLQLLFPMGALGWLFSLVQQARASAERLLSVMAVEGAISYPSVSILPALPAYRWENLGYRYQEGGAMGISGTVWSGEGG